MCSDLHRHVSELCYIFRCKTLICRFLCHLKVRGCDQYADKFILAVETTGADDTADSIISSILFCFVIHTMQ